MITKSNKRSFAVTRPCFAASYILAVRDLDAVSAFYQDIIGLELLQRDNNLQVLGVDGRSLLTLHGARSNRHAAASLVGLFHAAFLLPQREDLGRFLEHLMDRQVPVSGLGDHLVSEAVYLSDPEGNGIEVYADRNPESWTFDADGVVMDTVRLDVSSLLAASPGGAWTGLPTGTVLGHLHLKVGDLDEADQFFRGLLGMDLMEQIPGARFFASGGYHHHVAVNTWTSKRLRPSAGSSVGLVGYTFTFKDRSLLEDALGRLNESGYPVKPAEGGWQIRDPWGHTVSLVPLL